MAFLLGIALPTTVFASPRQETMAPAQPLLRESNKLTLHNETRIVAPGFTSLSGRSEGFSRSVIVWTGTDSGPHLNIARFAYA
ncbi:MAG: hypothetical protein ABI068_04835 [Ktedonobacterales bacterium]